MDDQLITFTLTILSCQLWFVEMKERYIFFLWNRELFWDYVQKKKKNKIRFYLRDKCEGFSSSLPGTFAVASLYFSYMLSSLLLPSLNVHWSVSKICY